MNPDYMLACGIVWRKTADPEAGLELLEALESPDLGVRVLARGLLIYREEESVRWLESALTSGTVSPKAAGGGIAEILRNRQDSGPGMNAERRLGSDPSLC